MELQVVLVCLLGVGTVLTSQVERGTFGFDALLSTNFTLSDYMLVIVSHFTKKMEVNETDL